MTSSVGILSIGVAVPPYKLDQKTVGQAVLEAVPKENRRISQMISRIYKSGGIEKRHTVLKDFFSLHNQYSFIPDSPKEHNGPSTEYRNNLFIRHTPALACLAVKNAFAKVPALIPENVTHLITVSCTGFSAPGFDSDIIEKFNLDPCVARLNIGFMGCYAAIPALRTANSICLADSKAIVLIVSVELCSLHYRHVFDAETILANSLFADGAGAVIVSSQKRLQPIAVLGSFLSTISRDTRDQMGWIIGNHGFTMQLSPKVPHSIGAMLPDIVSKITKTCGFMPNDISAFAIHPGGRAILDQSEKALGLPRESLLASRKVLANFGNMSSCTILFVLEELLQQQKKELVFVVAFGPGLCAETALLTIV
jgi:predicted naringenin-chalcone synthase